MTWEAEDIKELRKRIAKLNKFAERMRIAEAAGDETNAVGAGLALDAEMYWLGPACVQFAESILDAFEAMQEHNWMIHRNNTETATGDVVECWDVVASDGTCLAELGDPISSLLAAAQTLEDKSDA